MPDRKRKSVSSLRLASSSIDRPTTRDHHGRETKKIIHARTRVRVSRPVHKETALEYMEREKEGIIIKRKRALVH